MAETKVPYSNMGGNNQTSPGVGGIQTVATKATVPGSSLGNAGNGNPFMPAPIAVAGTGSGTGLGITGTPTMPSGSKGSSSGSPSDGSLYNPASSYSSGETDIMKQLIDIYGKGTGGMLNYLLKSMSGTDSAIFKQYLASMVPQEAAAKAGLSSTLGSMGVGPNSSVNAIAQSNLSSQFNAEASRVNSELMRQQLQDTIGIVESTMPDAKKEVASSGWTVFADVMNQITGDIGNMIPGASGNKTNTHSDASQSVPSMMGQQLTSGGVDTSMDAGISESMSPSMASVLSIFQ